MFSSCLGGASCSGLSALGTAGSWVTPCLVYRWKPLWEFSLINPVWGYEFPGSLESCCQCSHSKGSGPSLSPGN